MSDDIETVRDALRSPYPGPNSKHEMDALDRIEARLHAAEEERARLQEAIQAFLVAYRGTETHYSMDDETTALIAMEAALSPSTEEPSNHEPEQCPTCGQYWPGETPSTEEKKDA